MKINKKYNKLLINISKLEMIFTIKKQKKMLENIGKNFTKAIRTIFSKTDII